MISGRGAPPGGRAPGDPYGAAARTATLDASQIQTLEDVKLWAVEHDARIDAWWREQFRKNDGVECRMSSVERKVMWLAGAAAAIGAFLGVILAGTLFNGG